MLRMFLKGIDHLALKVRDLRASDHFYREILGMECVGEQPGMRFYATGAHHHDLALLEVGPGAGPPRADETGLVHFCLGVVSEEAWAWLYRHCRETDIPVSAPFDHTVMRSFYALDLDGHIVEIGMDVPKAQWAHVPGPFSEDYPYTFRSGVDCQDRNRTDKP